MTDYDLLSNASFEAGSGIATGWSDFHTTATEAGYSLVTSGVTDGTLAQHITYAGAAGDSGALSELFQGPFTASPGQVFTFRLWASGSYSGCLAQIGISARDASNTYISENDTLFAGLRATPQLFQVSYACPPLTASVACFFIASAIGPSSSFAVTLDEAALFVPASVPEGVPHPGGGSGFDPFDTGAGVGEPGRLGNPIGLPGGLA